MYNKNKILFLLPVALLFLSLLAGIAFLLSSDSLDDRMRASSEIAVSLSPAAGKITADGLGIDLILDTHGKTIFGVDITLEYSGDIDYDRFAQGNIKECVVKDVRQTSTKVNLHCFIDPSKNYSGKGDVFAKVYFAATETGSAEINITEVLLSDSTGEVSFKGGSGNYEADFTESEIALDLDPKSGVISGQGTDIDLVINTYEEEVGGVDATLQYSGDIEYVSLEQGELSNCEVSETKLGEKKLGFYCFIDPSKAPYKGSGDVFATLKFRATGSGSSEIEVTDVVFSVRDDRNEVSHDGGSGEYSTEGGDGGPITKRPSCGTLNNAVFPYSMSSWPSQSFCSEGEANPSNPTFPALGGSTNWQCVSIGKETDSVSCSASRELEPVKCGSLNNKKFTHNTETWPAGDFCIGGQPNPANPVFPVLGGSTTWQCVGTDDSTASCKSEREVAPPLPDTSIFDSLGILGGLGLVVAALTIFVYKGTDVRENYSMRDKLS